MKKPMSPTLTFELAENNKWTYEIKYDGYRCLLYWDENKLDLISKNGRSLNNQFPEIISFFLHQKDVFLPSLPLILDGELAVLENPHKGNFSLMQKRGKLRKEEPIKAKAIETPATFLTFDLLKVHGEDLTSLPYSERKQQLEQICTKLRLESTYFKYIENNDDLKKVKDTMELYEGEGLIAKLKTSKWEYGKSEKWLKLKNWRHITCFITAFEKENGFFHVGVLDKDKVISIGLFKHGIPEAEREILLQTIKANASKDTKDFTYIDPSICVRLKCLELYEGQLREPYFDSFALDLTYLECTLQKLNDDLHPLPSSVEVTNKEKMLWKELHITKATYIKHLHFIAPFLLPFLEDRPLTVIRYPNGIHHEAFYQKNCPDYAPSFVKTWYEDETNFILCNDLETLLWLGNQGAIEFHIPYQKTGDTNPSDIILDLDPPSVNEFSLAVKAAMIIKEVCDSIDLKAFAKTSGGKGIQVFIPLPQNKYSYEDTRLFTSFIADFLTTKEPTFFTTERMKSKRGNKLYVDYVQHAKGKTIIAPYSVRANEQALVSTPLFWEEVDMALSPYDFSIQNIQSRIKEKGCPFQTYSQVGEDQPFDEILTFLKKQS